MDKQKVLLVNGSPHKEGCVFTILTEIADTLKDNDVDAALPVIWHGC